MNSTRLLCEKVAETMPAELHVEVSLSEKLSAALLPKAQAIIAETAQELIVRSQEKIEDPHKSGRVYLHGPQPLPHQASAPGEAPANWTGHLKDSFSYTETGELEATVTVGAEYGADLELGTVHMAPRPFLTPTVDEIAPEFRAKMAALLESSE